MTSDEALAEIYERLRWLDALEAAGVDNWEGIDLAHKILEEWKDEPKQTT